MAALVLLALAGCKHTTARPAPADSAGRPTPTVYYDSCADAPGPIRSGEPGYREALDRNHDGVACEDD